MERKEKSSNTTNKNTRGKRWVKPTIIFIGSVVLATSAYVVVQKVINNSPEKPTEEQQGQIKKRKEEEKQLIEDINNDIKDKDPDDIVIPDDATKEEKEKLQEEKKYWTTTKNLKESVESCVKKQVEKRQQNGESLNSIEDELKNFVSVRRINNIYVYDDNSLLIDCDYLFNETYLNTKALRQTNAFLVLKTPNQKIDINNIDDLIGFINDDNIEAAVQAMNINSNSNNLEEFYKNHVMTFAFQDYLEQGYKASLVNITCDNAGDSPTSFKCITKLESENKTFYLFNQINSSMETQNMSKDEWVKFATTKGSDTERIFVTSTEKWGALNFDWKSLSEEYSGQKTQEAQAQAEIEEISTRDENGKVTGMAWDESQEKVEKKKAQNAAKLASQDAAMDYMPLYSDQELSL